MPIIETFALSIGGALAKEVVKSLLGSDSKLIDAAGALVDFLKDEGTKSILNAEEARKVKTLAKNIAEQTLDLFKREGLTLSLDDQNRVKAEVAGTIASVPLTAELIVTNNLDSDQIAKEMLNQRAEEIGRVQLSTQEHSLYESMVRRCVSGMCDVIITTSTFVPHMLGEAMRRQDKFQSDILDALIRRAEQEKNNEYTERSNEFKSQYLKVAQKEWDKLELFGIREVDDRTVNADTRHLTKAYVSLSVHESSDLEKREIPDSEKEKVLDAWTHSLKQNTILKNESVEGVIALSPRIVVSGIAGSGKSTLLKYIGVKTAGNELPAELAGLHDAVPVILRLRRYAEEAFPNVEEWLKKDFPVLPAQPESWMRNQLNNGYAIVMVDGVDEMPANKREDMLNALKQLVELYPAARYIITSRREALEDWPAWREWMKAESFTMVVMDAMNPDQHQALVERWFAEYRAITQDGDSLRRLQGMEAKLNALLKTRVPLQKLASNPLMCAMICVLYEEYGDDLPARRTDLYEKCIEMALSKRDDKRGVPSIKDYRVITDKRLLIQYLAEWMMVTGDSVDEAKLLGQMDIWLTERGLNQTTTGIKMLDFYVERAGLLRKPVKGSVEFEHRTFQEYLTANEITRRSRIADLSQRINDPRWHEVVVLAAGLAVDRDRNDLLKVIANDNIMSRLKGIDKFRLGFLLECLEVLGNNVTPKEKTNILLTFPGITPHIKSLDLSAISVRDLSPLTGLTNLQGLNLGGTSVSDLSPLTGLTNLQRLDLMDTSVSDLSPLSHHKKLKITRNN